MKTKYVEAKYENERGCAMKLTQADNADITADGNVCKEGFNGEGMDIIGTGKTDFDEALIALDNDGDYRNATEISKEEFDNFQTRIEGDFGFIKGGGKDE